MKNVPTTSPEQLQSAYHGAVELAYLVADSLSLVSLRELWKRSDFSVLDKEMFHMLRGGSEKGKEKTASELVTAMSEKIQESTSTTELVKYDLLAPFFRKRLKKMRELFADPEVRKEFFKGFNDRKEHREVLATGKKDVEQVKQLDVELKNLTKQKHTLMLEKFFKGVKMSDIEKSTINEALIDIDDQLSNLESQKYSLLKNPNTAHRETATVWRLEELKKMKRRDGYVMTPSRQSIFNNAVEKFLEGNHILLKGDTGSGKTAIAVQIAKYIEELSAGKIKTMQIDGKKLESEAKDPEKLRKTEQMVFSGNPFTTQSDLIGKSKLKGDIEMEFQYSKLLTAFMEGRVLIFDELDSVPGDVLYRIKHLFEQRPMSLYAPQEDGGDRKTLLQTKIIATANIHSEHKYRDKEKIPVPIQDNLVGIEVPYMPKDEIYDFALVEMMTKDGFIKGVGERELTKEGIIDSLIECIDHIEQLFTGKTIGDLRIGTIGNNAEYSLKYAIWTMRSLIPLFREWKGKDVNTRIKTEIVDFIAKATDPDDRKVLLKVFAQKGFLGKQDIEPRTAYKHRNGTLSLTEVLHLPKSDLKAILTLDTTSFQKSITPFLDPYEVANLDPYAIRNLKALTPKNPSIETFTKTALHKVYTKLFISTDPQIEKFTHLFSEITENANKKGQIDTQDIQSILDALYEVYDEENETLVETRSELSALGKERKKIAKTIENSDKTMEGAQKKFIKPRIQDNTGSPIQQNESQNNLSSIPRPDRLKAYQMGRETGIKRIDAMKKQHIKKVAEDLIQSGKITYEQHPQGGWITHFKGIPKMQDTKFYDATNLVQAEKQGTEEMTAIYTYDVFGEKNQTNLVCLRAIRGNDKSKWKSKTIATLVEDQKKQYGLGLHSQAGMKTCFTALRNAYQSSFYENLDQQEQIALWMYLTGCYGRYRLSDYGKHNSTSRSYLICRNGYRIFYRYDYVNRYCSFLL